MSVMNWATWHSRSNTNQETTFSKETHDVVSSEQGIEIFHTQTQVQQDIRLQFQIHVRVILVSSYAYLQATHTSVIVWMECCYLWMEKHVNQVRYYLVLKICNFIFVKENMYKVALLSHNCPVRRWGVVRQLSLGFIILPKHHISISFGLVWVLRSQDFANHKTSRNGLWPDTKYCSLVWSPEN